MNFMFKNHKWCVVFIFDRFRKMLDFTVKILMYFKWSVLKYRKVES